ncbi:arsenical pump-driving ATPase [Acidipropionibacterium jensenii]|uniref:arsenical pump-driving ATPase n=1 Tax=Acidipropionibacterium jensenii TaxID=1749 RepID=UPI00264A3226|nr:arsenical pump-driving ATPase [Acidipropionibacterium jensenii]MDN6427818.1 arsenical pump-driving ATPase [Acidipropionibacterium jensenii]
MTQFLDNPPRHFFFTGKGGVGKTSIACATAVHLAHQGKRVLLVSTDPASNIAQVFGATIGNKITPIPQVPGLDALEIDPDEAAEAYRNKILEPVRAVLPIKEIEAITEQLSGSCTTEIASFNEFTDLLADTQATAGYDHVIFDTAPTGHTIRLLQLPGSWTSYLDNGKGDASCLGPMSGLEKNRATYRAAVEALTDPTSTRLVLVARAQQSTLREVARTLDELAELDIHATNLVVNGVLPAAAATDDLSRAIHDREQAALAAMPAALAALPRDTVSLKSVNMVGLEALATLFHDEDAPQADAQDTGGQGIGGHPHLARQVDALPAEAAQGLVMTMGKGGVGKTTVAAAIAIALVQRGKKVLLTTTDPAAHLSTTLGNDVDGLEVSAIDPEKAIQEYRDHVMASKGAKLDDAGRAALAEDLMSPCTEEIAVFQQFSRAVNKARDQFVIMDTAPTGHTLLLMDATGSYHRDITRHLDDDQRGHVTTPLMRLQDPDHTKIIVVTLPETTPVTEAQALASDLERANIHPWAWVVNNSLAAAHPTSPLLATRARSEQQQLDAVAATTNRMAVIPTQTREPVGTQQLTALSN